MKNEINKLTFEFVNSKENQRHNNTPLIEEGRFYPMGKNILFRYLDNIGKVELKKTTQAKQTPQEQQQQHKLNILYLCSLFHNQVRI